MPEEDQERFEDYLELERYIADLQAGRLAHPPRDLTPEQARIYRMAALFRSISPENTTPRPEFVEQLRAYLLAMETTPGRTTEPSMEHEEEETLKIPAIKKTAPLKQPVDHEPEPVPEVPAQQRRATPKQARFFSRRSLITGSAVAAASLVVGVGVGTTINRPETPPQTTEEKYRKALVEKGTLHFVAMLDQVGEDALRFATDTIVGYIIRSDGDDDEPAGSIIAMSAACTHMGCIVQWNESDHSFHCPCHGGMFTAYGKPAGEGRTRYLAPLPRLKTVVQHGKVYVVVPDAAS
jgi:Rieske Fe-S protein